MPNAPVESPFAAAEEFPELGAAAPGGVLRERYRLVRSLGAGAHGRTYFARHQFMNYPCVAKMLPHRIADPADPAVQRLRSEALAGQRVDHPNVVRVIDCDSVEGFWYFVMEFVAGADLSTLSADKLRPDWRQAARLAFDVARGLAAIHALGLLHRDIKPANLILGLDGRLRVADLGVASLAPPLTTMPTGTSADRVSPGVEPAGTLGFAAPEMFSPETSVGATADLYSLGATLYFLLTGRTPYETSSVVRALVNAQQSRVEWPDDSAETPAWLRDLILRLLAAEPAERPPSATALADELLIQAPFLGDVPNADREPASAPKPESAPPRGVAVLPFQPAVRTKDTDWLGAVIAESVARALSRVRGVYVVEAERLLAILRAQAGVQPLWPHAALLAAGRLVGAGAVVDGEFIRYGSDFELRARVHTEDSPEPPLDSIHGTLAENSTPLRELFVRLAARLKIPLADGEPPRHAFRPVRLDAQELLVQAKHVYQRGEYAGALALAEQAAALDADYVEPLQYTGASYARLGRYEDAARQHHRQESIALERGDFRLLVEALANLGVMHYLHGDYAAAIQFYTPAVRRAEELGLTAELAHVYNNLGFALFHLQRLNEAENAFRRAIEIHRSFGALAALVAPYNGLGNVVAEQRRFAEAATYYRKALQLAAETGDRANVGVAYMHLGRSLSQDGDIEQAKFALARALNVLEETRFWSGLGRAYEHVAALNLELGDYSEADRCADRRIALCRLYANPRMEAAAWVQKAQALRGAGRAAEADRCLEQSRALQP